MRVDEQLVAIILWNGSIGTQWWVSFIYWSTATQPWTHLGPRGLGHIHCCAWLHSSAAADADCVPLFVAKMCALPCFSRWTGACRWGFSGPGSSFPWITTCQKQQPLFPPCNRRGLLCWWKVSIYYSPASFIACLHWCLCPNGYGRNATFWAVATFKVE